MLSARSVAILLNVAVCGAIAAASSAIAFRTWEIRRSSGDYQMIIEAGSRGAPPSVQDSELQRPVTYGRTAPRVETIHEPNFIVVACHLANSGCQDAMDSWRQAAAGTFSTVTVITDVAGDVAALAKSFEATKVQVIAIENIAYFGRRSGIKFVPAGVLFDKSGVLVELVYGAPTEATRIRFRRRLSGEDVAAVPIGNLDSSQITLLKAPLRRTER